ncbi:hypothetical protein [Streptomyces sp. NRRL F-2580]|uniref:hypothetical protein n=1 Tax=Streptomyces sp. NRRL F-2580 TaxID=1463841 RepID=UPI00069087A5|nr:hypothetical protein [Streptomyces sp. NRRL F-2580]
MGPITGWLLAGTVCLAASGCAPVGERAEAAETAAQRFERALMAADDVRVCDALAPATREELEAEAPCGPSLAALRLPAAAGRAERVDVYGSQALVVFAQDSVFLASFPDGWRVTAAGCTPRTGRPYHCELKGD